MDGRFFPYLGTIAMPVARVSDEPPSIDRQHGSTIGTSQKPDKKAKKKQQSMDGSRKSESHGGATGEKRRVVADRKVKIFHVPLRNPNALILGLALFNDVTAGQLIWNVAPVSIPQPVTEGT